MEKYKVTFFLLAIVWLISCRENETPVAPVDEETEEPEVCEQIPYSTSSIMCITDDTTDELTIATWNIERFPQTANSLSKAADLITSLNADVYAIQEITDLTEFENLVNSLPDYDGEALNVNGSLELGYIYKTSEITSFGPLTEIFDGLTSPFPREPVVVDIVHSNGLAVKLINIHLKCCGGSENESRREDASVRLKKYIDDNFPDDEVIILGDWNEELGTGSSFSNFQNNCSQFLFLDAPISEGSNNNWSFPSWPSHIDHILASNELYDNVISVYTSRADECIDQYLTEVSDHRPVIVSLKADN